MTVMTDAMLDSVQQLTASPLDPDMYAVILCSSATTKNLQPRQVAPRVLPK